MSKKKVLIVDDSAMVRRAVRRFFDSDSHFEVCGEARHGREALEKVSELRPDLIILDLWMPVMNGLEAAPLLLKTLPHVRIILFTSYEDAEVHRLSRRVGIHAVVSKSNAATRLVSQAHTLLTLDSAA
jgi:DNA-binding NarL/FixJ family response regulator